MLTFKVGVKGDTMSIVISTGTSDTAISGVTAPAVTLPVLNFGVDFRVKAETSKETILSNTTSPLDQPESIRFGFSEIANIYANSGLNSDQIPGTVKGVNILAQITDTIKVTDTANAAFGQYLPVSAHIVIKAPQSGYITPAVVQTLINRLYASLYENGSSNLAPLLKGVLTPRAL